MKISYLSFSILAFTLSTNGYAQSTPELPEPVKSSLATQLELQEVKHGPLTDFYELVAQYQLARKVTAKTAHVHVHVQADLPLPATRELIADTKNSTAPKP